MTLYTADGSARRSRSELLLLLLLSSPACSTRDALRSTREHRQTPACRLVRPPDALSTTGLSPFPAATMRRSFPLLVLAKGGHALDNATVHCSAPLPCCDELLLLPLPQSVSVSLPTLMGAQRLRTARLYSNRCNIVFCLCTSTSFARSADRFHLTE